ncbi:hypothetical protein F383_11814 [Gossypium arboreum]|uniref:Uncharacterized protein n=1 Tax=Gossypium arboreum TaxID=29729 RepID=A0A0B0PVN3_GOSAR|nr:hypothetical protein F383_11814 [Gossypium arboreum]
MRYKLLYDANVNISIFVKYIRLHDKYKNVILKFDSRTYVYECVYIFDYIMVLWF